MTGLPEQLVMPCPFAGGEGAALATIPGGVTENEVNFTEGFPSVYSAPKSNNGKFVKRSELNAIGNMGTKNDFYRMCGGINTFNPEFCTAVGGYPKGAILDYFNGVDFLKVLSLEDNNTHDFRQGDFGTSWMLLNQGEQILSPSLTIANIKDLTIPFSNMGISMIYVFAAPRDGVITTTISNYKETNATIASSVSYSLGKGIVARAFKSNETVVYPIIQTSSSGNTYNGYKLMPGLPSPINPAIAHGSYQPIAYPEYGFLNVSRLDLVVVGIQNGCNSRQTSSTTLQGNTIEFDLTINLL